MNITDHSNFVKEQKALSAIINVFQLREAFLFASSKNTLSLSEAFWWEKGLDYVTIHSIFPDRLLDGKFDKMMFVADGYSMEVKGYAWKKHFDTPVDSCPEENFDAWSKSLGAKFDTWLGLS